MADRHLLDTNILIDVLRQRTEAVKRFSGLTDLPFTSPVVLAELYAGVRVGAERLQLDQ
jgi:predicted nucleic acid-binding protein